MRRGATEPYGTALTLALGFKIMALATLVAEGLVGVGLLTHSSGGESEAWTLDLNAQGLGAFILLVVAFAFLPCLLAAIGYALEVLVGIFDRSGWHNREDDRRIDAASRTTGPSGDGRAQAARTASTAR